jgi:hypothetical protein
MRRRTFLTAAAGAAGLALAGRMRGAVPARAAPAADQKTLIMAPNFVIRSLDPGHPFGYRSDLRGVTYNSVWEVDFYPIRRV